MPATKLHDVIVVGTELAGLLAAGLLRRKGYSVLLVGQGGLRDQYEHEGLPTPALPHMLPPRGQSPLLDALLDDLAVEDPIHKLGVRSDDHVQVVTPQIRVDLFPERKRLEKELDRAVRDQREEFLKVSAQLERADQALVELLRQTPPLPADGLRERARLKRLERQLGASGANGLRPTAWPTLMRILAAATAFTSNLDTDLRLSLATARLVRMLLAGPRLVPGLAQHVVDAVARVGVDIELSMVAEQFLMQGKAVIGLQALRSAATHQCEVMLAGLPLAELVELVPPGNRKPRSRLAADALRPRTCAFCLNLVLPREALPAGMANHVLLVRDPDAALTEENLIQVTRLPIPERKDRIHLSTACLMPYRKRSLGREYLGPLQARVMEALGYLIPFLDRNLETSSSPFWSSRSTDAGHPAPWLIHRTIEPLAPPALGLGVHPPRTPIKNLLLCGPEVVAGLGLEGQAMAAQRVAGWLAEHHKLKQIL